MKNNPMHPHKTDEKTPKFQDWQAALELANAAPRCGAKTRKLTFCKSPAMRNGRCRMHGGKSTGAPTGNSNAFKHGCYSQEILEEMRYFRELVVEANELIEKI